MQTIVFPANERGIKQTDWLQSNFFFSFANFQNPTKTSFGSLMAFNDDFVKPGKGFGIHPHTNMEIISIMLKGKMTHKDNMGYDTIVSEDGVQIMSAGSGLYHEEHTVGEEEVNFLQIWILPKQQNIRPRYQVRQFPKNKRQNQLTTIVSGEEGSEHCWTNQNAKLSLGLYEANQSVTYNFNPTNKCLFVFVIKGALMMEDKSLQARDGLGIWETNTITVHCTEPSEFLIIETPVNQK